MTENIIFDDIKVPSINGKFGYSPKNNKFYLTKEYKSFKEIIALKARRPILSPYAVYITWLTYHDIDNAIKAILDGLKKGGCIDDDKNIHELHVIKRPARKGQRNTLSITVKSLYARGEL